MDFSQILSGLSVLDAVAAILAAGALIAMLMWTIVVVRQIANFFGVAEKNDRTLDGWYSGGYSNYSHSDDFSSISKSVDRHMRKRS